MFTYHYFACIVYGIWRSFTARHEYISGIVCCTDKYKDKTDTYLPIKIGDFTNLSICQQENT